MHTLCMTTFKIAIAAMTYQVKPLCHDISAYRYVAGSEKRGNFTQIPNSHNFEAVIATDLKTCYEYSYFI